MIKTQMEMYLHEELETLTRTEIEALQFERLLRTVRRCMKSPFYQKRFAEAHLSPEDICLLDDLRKIPFTTKQDLRDNYPFRACRGADERSGAPAFFQWHDGHPYESSCTRRRIWTSGPMPWRVACTWSA